MTPDNTGQKLGNTATPIAQATVEAQHAERRQRFIAHYGEDNFHLMGVGGADVHPSHVREVERGQ